MGMGDKEKYGMDDNKSEEDQMNYSNNVSSDWRFEGSNLIGSSSCSSAPMTLWDQPMIGSQSLGFCENGPMGIRKPEMCWNPIMKGGLFLPGGPIPIPIPHQGLSSQLPADSAFIERAARFSSFNGGNFSGMINPFAAVPENLGNFAEGSPLKSSKSHDEAKQQQPVGFSENESDEAEFSSGAGAVGQDEPSSMLECAKGNSSRKRKRNGQGSNKNEADDNTELQHKGDENPNSSTPNKSAAKNGKQGSQASDPTKEEYIHVRARRGQATNSHSLAERVRREKISERMKFLQDLVPGCNKVTGKAVMLDEIINYVQSLQRQVEFLSMKLATVNPRLDFNLEGLLAKDMIQSRVVGSSSSLAYAPDMPIAYPSLQQSQQQSLIQPSISGMASASEILRRTISSQLTSLPLGFKEPTQLPNVWEDELNNVVQMSFGARTCPNTNTTQDSDGSLPASQMKVEL